MLDLILFTHSDMDGYGCKLVMDVTMKLLNNSNYKVIICNNASTAENRALEYIGSDKVGSDTVIVFSDLCPSAEFIEKELIPLMSEHGIKDLMITDHHDTNTFANDLINGHAHIVADDRFGKLHSGTSLLYMQAAKYLDERSINTSEINEQLYADLVENIRSYDTYTWKVENNIHAKRLNMMFSMIGGDNFVQKYFDRITCKTQPALFTDTELEFINYKIQYTTDIVNSITPDDFTTVDIRGYKVALMMKSVGANINEIADRFLETFPEYDAVIQFSMFGNWQFSIRSRRDDLNSAQVFAVPLGGGGHPKSCGAPVPSFMKDALVDIVTNYLAGHEVTISVSSANYSDKL